MTRVCASPDCENTLYHRHPSAKYCSKRCYYYVRSRDTSRREYKRHYNEIHRDERYAYMREWNARHHRVQLIEHIRAYYRVKRLQRQFHFQHIRDYLKAHPTIPKMERDRLRSQRREQRRWAARKLVAAMTDTSPPPQPTKKMLRNRLWRDNNREWISAYSKMYREKHREQVAAAQKIRGARNRKINDAAVEILTSVGVKL